MTELNTEWPDEIDGARGDFALQDLERYGPGPCGQSDIDRVRADAMRAIAKLPDPREFGRILEITEPELAEALRAGFLFHEPNEYHAYRLRQEHKEYAQALFSLGCIEARGLFLTGFGIAVRRAMLEEDDDV